MRLRITFTYVSLDGRLRSGGRDMSCVRSSDFWRGAASLLCGVAVLGGAESAYGAPPPLAVPISSEQVGPGGQRSFSGYLSSLERSNFLLGDLFGVRTALSKIGVSLAIQETSEMLANVTGGMQTYPAYDGLTQAILQLYTRRAFGWYGGLLNASALQLHGYNLNGNNPLSLYTANGIPGTPPTHLLELWYQQKLPPRELPDHQIGQQTPDSKL